MIKEIHSEDLPSGITLEDVRKARESYYEKPSLPVLDVLTDSRHQYTIILGDPGSGKSTLARYVMLSLVDPSTSDDKLQKAFAGYLPLLIELRTYTGTCAEGNCGSFLEFLEYLGKTEGWALTQSALHNHLKNDGRAEVIFDGLDEIFDPEQREQITRQIVGFCNDYPKVRVIVTSRVIGYRRKILTDAGFTHFTLQDLDEKQVESFVTRWYDLAMSDRLDEAKERCERILKSFQDSVSICQLAGNPMLLTIMAIIGKHQELPRERWKLYDHAASVLIQHWDVNKHLKDESIQADFIGEDDKKELLRRLAFRMQSGAGGLAGNYIHREGLQAEFESYLIERYKKEPDRAKVIAETMIQQFRERNFILSLYGANLYGFVHRAFLEYFCAWAFVYKFEKTKELTIEQLKIDVYGKQWEDQSWHEVLRLICGMIDEKWAGNVINFLVNDINRPWPQSFRNHMPINILPAVQCVREVKNPRAIDDEANLLLMAICDLFGYAPKYKGIVEILIQINSGVELIRGNWPQRQTLVDWLRIPRLIDDDVRYFVTLGKFVSLITPGLDEAYDLIWDYTTKDEENSSIFALITLAEGWPRESRTISLFLSSAEDTKKPLLRLAAILWSGSFRDNPQTLPLLREHAVKDENADVRGSAVSALAEHYRQDPETLPLLREWAVKSELADVRGAAVSALAQHYRENPENLSLLRERAVKDDDSDVRRAAVSALAQHYRDDPGTLPLLRERAVKDKNEYVRRAAVSALAKYYREDPETLPLLHERAVKDDSLNVRRVSVDALIEHYRDDPETLPLLRARSV